jgi:hypothetical protein
MSLSEEQRTEILSSLRAGVSLAAAARGMMTTEKACRALAAVDPEWAAAIEAATPVPVVDVEPTLRELREAAAAKVRAAFVALSAQKASEDAAEEAEAVAVAPVATAPRDKASAAIFRPDEEDAPRLQSPREADKWARVREEAAALGPEKIGYLHWVDKACVDARPRLHPMDPVWLDHYCRFYESGKRVDVARKGLRAGGSDSSCRVIVAELLLLEKTLEPGLECVGLVVSAVTKDCEDRFDTIKENLRACGFRELKGRSKEDEDDDGRYRTAGGGNTGNSITLRDAQGNPIEFRISAANEAGVASCTAGAALGDELDLWGRKEGKNPASKIVEVLITRISSVPGAVVHLMSATYDRDSHHAKMIRDGDTVRQRVSRLGAHGAQLDTEARGRLASLICSSDPLLLTPGDPMSTDLPTWVCNPYKVPIETCYELADGDLARMISLYGARPDLTVSGDDNGTDARAQIMGIDARRAGLSRPLPLHPGYDAPRSGSGRRFTF